MLNESEKLSSGVSAKLLRSDAGALAKRLLLDHLLRLLAVTGPPNSTSIN